MEAEIRNLINLIRQSSHVEAGHKTILESLAKALAADPESIELRAQIREHEMLLTEAGGTIEGYTRWLLRLVGSEEEQ